MAERRAMKGGQHRLERQRKLVRESAHDGAMIVCRAIGRMCLQRFLSAAA